MNSASLSLILLALMSRRVEGDSVNQPDRSITVQEGQNVLLSCKYETTTSPYLFWYKQNIYSSPQLLLASYDTEGHSQNFSANLDKVAKSFHLIKESVELKDTAVYFCALSDTVSTVAWRMGQKPTQWQNAEALTIYSISSELLNKTNWLDFTSCLFLFHMMLSAVQISKANQNICFASISLLNFFSARSSKMFLSWSLVLLILGKSTGVTITQTEGTVTIIQGQPVFLNCTYEKSVDYQPSPFWYIQYLGHPPKVFQSVSLISSPDVSLPQDFEVTYNKREKTFNMKKLISQLNDSAIYFCAVSSTVRVGRREADQKPAERQMEKSICKISRP
ncbi:uncharacterized protein LOC134497076 [Candoia aspera]|uniref:uncharacterized protein LOC134497076 n=1 Tax=Candoia aspera TaxID=51853 RepID=UPI002FD85A79